MNDEVDVVVLTSKLLHEFLMLLEMFFGSMFLEVKCKHRTVDLSHNASEKNIIEFDCKFNKNIFTRLRWIY